MTTDLQVLTISLEEAAAKLLTGKVGVMPTDTVYGLVCRAEDAQAVTRLYALKSRERKPGTIIAASVQQLLTLGVSEADIRKVKTLWPGPVSAVLVVKGREYLHQGLGDIAMRVVADDKLQRILLQTGPLLTTSANQPGAPVAQTVKEAHAYFADTIDFYVDGGIRTHNVPSTLIALKGDGTYKVLREGAVKAAAINSKSLHR